jgi:hypothetical protein
MFSIVLITITLSNGLFIQNVFSISPSFTPQKIDNSGSDWFLLNGSVNQQDVGKARNIAECTTQQHQFPSPRITSVTYSSNGKTISSTLWLENPTRFLSLHGTKDSFPFSGITTTYGMVIHLNSDNNYQVFVQYNAITRSWTKVVEQ